MFVLQESGMTLITAEDLDDAAEKAVKASVKWLSSVSVWSFFFTRWAVLFLRISDQGWSRELQPFWGGIILAWFFLLNVAIAEMEWNVVISC